MIIKILEFNEDKRISFTYYPKSKTSQKSYLLVKVAPSINPRFVKWIITKSK
jgi:hypothetical protein